MLTAPAHFSFTVSHIGRSKAFYGEVLGLEQVYEMEHTHPYTSRQVGFSEAWLLAVGFKLGRDLPDGYPILELIEYRHPCGNPIDLSTNNPGVAHLAFEVDDIFAEYARLTESDVSFRSEPVLIEAGRNRGGYTAYFVDPDGITLELAQPPVPVMRMPGESVSAQR